MDSVHAGRSEKGWKGSGQSWTEICELTTSGLVPLGHLLGAGVRLGKKEALNFISYSPLPSSTSMWSLLICSFRGVAEIIQNTTKSFIPLPKIHVRWVYLLQQQVLIETQKELEEHWWVRQPGWWAPAQRQGVYSSGEGWTYSFQRQTRRRGLCWEQVLLPDLHRSAPVSERKLCLPSCPHPSHAQISSETSRP